MDRKTNMQPDYEWDPEKEWSNFIKHGIRITQELTVLEDDWAITIEDQHSHERRFITLGMDENGQR
jgi:uncharacterized DUF497 family protein